MQGNVINERLASWSLTSRWANGPVSKQCNNESMNLYESIQTIIFQQLIYRFYMMQCDFEILQ